jgi:hydroxyacyl-ACP dehydratase HTD2-like protein with hotdog domain
LTTIVKKDQHVFYSQSAAKSGHHLYFGYPKSELPKIPISEKSRIRPF